MKLFPDRLFRDVIPPAGVSMADYIGVQIPVEDTFLCGYVMTPDGTYDLPRPCVILCHGFPGFCKSDDIAQALCRMGCVVVVPNCRGGWSSGGCYSFTNYITDLITTAHWARSPWIAQTYAIDPDSILLVGHSLGASSALNAARKLPWLKGVVGIAPYDLSTVFDETPYGIDFLLDMGAPVLRAEGPDSIRRNAIACHKEMALVHAFDALKEQNLLLISGTLDEIAPPEKMITPLWDKLRTHNTTAIQNHVQFPSDHDFCSFRIALIEQIGYWIAALFQP